jgi:hypothetical protein
MNAGNAHGGITADEMNFQLTCQSGRGLSFSMRWANHWAHFLLARIAPFVAARQFRTMNTGQMPPQTKGPQPRLRPFRKP